MNQEDKETLHKGFLDGELEVLSVSADKKVEWKQVLGATRHDVSFKDQYQVCLDNGSFCRATGDHSLFALSGNYIVEQKTGSFSVGSELVCVEEDMVLSRKVVSNIIVPPEKYMYDLTVLENENFVLKSGVLAHNTFRPPASEKFLQAQAQVFGYVWEDYELYEYVLMAIDMFNTAPPVTGIDINNMPDRWRSTLLMRAAGMACGALSVNWIVNEFAYSVSGVSLDIEKSSKYESMKRNFYEEADKSQELAKKSIKLIRGLSQPRYGVGISSALGPYSKPGVQSRRNFAGGDRGGWS